MLFSHKKTTCCLLINLFQHLDSFGSSLWPAWGSRCDFWWNYGNPWGFEGGFEADLEGHSGIPLGRGCCARTWAQVHGWCPLTRHLSTVVSPSSTIFPVGFLPRPGTERKINEPKERGDTKAGVKAQLKSPSSTSHWRVPVFVHPTPASSFVWPRYLCARCSPGLSPLLLSLIYIIWNPAWEPTLWHVQTSK